MEDLIRRSDAIKAFCMDCKGQGEPCEHSDACKTMKVLRSKKKISAVEPKTKVIAQVTFDEDKLREVVHEAVERIKEEYDIVDNPDAVSVVRCKECRYQSVVTDDEEGTSYYMCGVWANATDENAFCSYGERRENAEG